MKSNLKWQVVYDSFLQALDLVQVIRDNVELVENMRVDQLCDFGSVATANVTVFEFVG